MAFKMLVFYAALWGACLALAYGKMTVIVFSPVHLRRDQNLSHHGCVLRGGFLSGAYQRRVGEGSHSGSA
ncbi:MAG: hypothetical protein ACLSVD_01510 [Eggerthellaceae bacterium]